MRTALREGAHCAAKMSDVVRLRVGGVVFEAEKSVLLRFENTFFHGLLSSGVWQPDADGAYFVDRPALGFDRILEYLSSGKLRVEGLTQMEEGCLYSSLDYLLIPYKRHYAAQIVIEGFKATSACELKDGRLCGAYMNDLIVWNVDTSAIEFTLIGHTLIRVICLQDGRVCSVSADGTIQLWNIHSRLCELTLTGRRVLELFDGRLCFVSEDKTIIKVWNMSTGECQITIHTQYAIDSIVQLCDGRICCGCNGDGTISIYSLLTGQCELSWKGHTTAVYTIVCIDATRLCSGSKDGTIKVWNIASGECERTLEGHTEAAVSLILLHDGRLCSGFYRGTIKLWNLETGECVNTLHANIEFPQMLQLDDGRLLCACRTGVMVWS